MQSKGNWRMNGIITVRIGLTFMPLRLQRPAIIFGSARKKRREHMRMKWLQPWIRTEAKSSVWPRNRMLLPETWLLRQNISFLCTIRYWRKLLLLFSSIMKHLPKMKKSWRWPMNRHFILTISALKEIVFGRNVHSRTTLDLLKCILRSIGKRRVRIRVICNWYLSSVWQNCISLQ